MTPRRMETYGLVLVTIVLLLLAILAGSVVRDAMSDSIRETTTHLEQP